MAGNVWVVAEQWKGSVSDATYEALALGRDLADGLGARLEAVLLGQGARALAESLGRADGVLYLDHPALADGTGDQTSQAPFTVKLRWNRRVTFSSLSPGEPISPNFDR